MKSVALLWALPLLLAGASTFCTKKMAPAGDRTTAAAARLQPKRANAAATPPPPLALPEFHPRWALDARGRAWVDSVYSRLSEDQRIGQLLMLRAQSNKDAAFEQMVEDQIRQTHAGGLCFFQGTPERQAELTNRYQAVADRQDGLPLLISMDAEYGLGMRLVDACITYPRQMALGAIQNDSLIYQYGREMARQCRRLGVQISFSPDADVNNNSANPVINDRSFGEDRQNVANKAVAYMHGLQDGNVMTSAKHFPGHGDTGTDSHFALPVIAHNTQRLDSLELFPFRALMNAGVGSFMVAHLNVPAIDPRAKYPTSLSRPTITGLLRKQMGFNGLVFTDAMEMKAVTDSFPAGVAAAESLKAGCDVVLLPADPIQAHAAIKAALADGSYDRGQFEQSVQRVLAAKYRLDVTTPQRVDLANIRREINTPAAYQMKRTLFENALTLVRDERNFTRDASGAAQPVSTFTNAVATLALGDTTLTLFQQICGRYAPLAHFNVGLTVDSLSAARLLDSLSQYRLVLVSHHKTRSRARDNYGLSDSQIALVNQLNRRTNVALTLFGNPYSAKYFDDCPALLVAFTEDPMAQEVAAQMWFGALDVRGKLPVTASPKALYKQGVTRHFTNKTLGFARPESVGMSSDTLAQLDSLAAQLIAEGAAPGCQVLVAKDGKIVWYKAYGRFTYEPTSPPVTTETLYDLASITKVAATTISAMDQAALGRFDVARPLSDYVPELRNTNKKDLVFGDILAHQAGLQAWIPFYEKTLDAQKRPLARLYRSQRERGFEVPVTPSLWLKNEYVDTIWQLIYQSELRPTHEYKYSDLTMYLTARAIQQATGKTVEQYATARFYQPMGLSSMTFNPWQRGWAARCAPTEDDNYFRQQRIQGSVHDMGAAMLGGVSGHAGLFSNANDLAKIFQMLLNGGTYGGRSYLPPAVVQQWIQRYGGSTRRGLGFDLKESDPKATANMSQLAGPNTYGHAGFTGNVVWADPDQRLIFIFLSNRTYPSMTNNKLITNDWRPRLQSVVYRSFQK